MIWRQSAKHPRLRRGLLDATVVRMPAPDIVELTLNEDKGTIESCVQAVPADQLLARYHELVDKGFEGQLPYIELFELERIQARLDVDDENEIGRLTTLHDNRQRERNDLISSIETLLARFEATP